MKKNWVKWVALLFFGISMLVFVLPLVFLPNLSDCRSYHDFCKSLAIFSLPLAACFPLSLLLFFLRDQVFYTWLKFSAVAIPVMLWVIYQSPPSAMGGFLASAMTTTRSETAIQISGLYIVISLILIGIKSWMLRQK